MIMIYVKYFAVLSMLLLIHDVCGTHLMQYQCFHKPGGQVGFSGTIRNDINGCAILSMTDNSGKICPNIVIDKAKSEHTFLLTVGSGLGVSNVAISPLPCGIIHVKGGTSYTIYLTTSSCESIMCMSSSDVLFQASCDFITDFISDVSAQSAKVTTFDLAQQMPKQQILSSLQPAKDLSLTVHKSDGTQVATGASLTLGTGIYLQVQLTKTERVSAVKMVDVVMYEMGNEVNAVTLYTSDGCAADLAFLPTGGFTIVSSPVTKFVSKSATFPLFRLSVEPGSVVFQGTARFCTQANADSCLAVTCSPRTRRSASIKRGFRYRNRDVIKLPFDVSNNNRYPKKQSRDRVRKFGNAMKPFVHKIGDVIAKSRHISRTRDVTNPYRDVTEAKRDEHDLYTVIQVV